jgi:hypothetical protein
VLTLYCPLYLAERVELLVWNTCTRAAERAHLENTRGQLIP